MGWSANVTVAVSPASSGDAIEADELAHRSGDPATLQLRIDLHHLLTGPIAGVRHLDAYLDRSLGVDFGRVRREGPVLERRVTQSVPERVGRSAVVEVGVGARLTAMTVSVRDRALTGCARNRDRNLARRVLNAEQDVGNRRAPDGSGQPRLHHRSGPAFTRQHGHRLGAEEDYDDRYAGRDDLLLVISQFVLS